MSGTDGAARRMGLGGSNGRQANFCVAWHFLACCLGLVSGNLPLAGFFCLVLTPFGLAKRCLTKPAISKPFDRQAPTCRKEAGPAPEPERYYKQF